MRIVSLLPSATEIVCALGLGDQLVGVTHECDYPPFVTSLGRVTRTLIPTEASSARIDELVRERLKTRRALYTLDLPVLQSLRPDLIVTQALCDVCAVAEDEVREAACSLPGAPRVVNLEPTTLDEVLDSLRTVGEAAGGGRPGVLRLRRRADDAGRADLAELPRLVGPAGRARRARLCRRWLGVLQPARAAPGGQPGDPGARPASRGASVAGVIARG